MPTESKTWSKIEPDRLLSRPWVSLEGKGFLQDMEHEVSKATSTPFKTIDKNGTKQVHFKTIDKSGTKRVPFKTIEDTSSKSIHFETLKEWIKARKANKSISFKTFADWVKARTANCDTALKDALSFVSEKKYSCRGGEGLMTSKTCTTR